MAKPIKVQSNDESDSSLSDDEKEYSKKDLMDMLEQDHSYMEKRKECKELRKKHDALEQSFDEFNTTHERLKEAHEKLGKAHTKLEKAHSTLFSQDKKQVVVTCDVAQLVIYLMNLSLNLSLLFPLTLLVAHLLLPHPLVMVSLVMPHLWLRMGP
jgi:exonuclease VII small subunit